MYAVSYMGTKRQLAHTVRDMVFACRKGPFLDLFSGMCSVAHAVSPHRTVWTNDLQHFAHAMARITFCANDHPPSALDLIGKIGDQFRRHAACLSELWVAEREMEKKALELESSAAYSSVFISARERANSIKATPLANTYDIFVNRFAGTYFSYKQAIEFDALRYALDVASNNRHITPDAYQWSVIALCVAMSKCSTTTGHFAQPLRPKENNFKKFRAQRTRSLYREWLSAIELLAPVGSRQWRKKNRAYHGDALALLPTLDEQKIRPSVIYADPPYTKDQYSRYYHIYETAILYDYPVATGNGLYRQGRVGSSFSSQAKVEESLDDLVRLCADIRADFILSYPTNGLVKNSILRIPEIIRQHYRKRPTVVTMEHAHSTMGASKGADRMAVTEVLYKVSFT